MNRKQLLLSLAVASTIFVSGCGSTHPWCKRWCGPSRAALAPSPNCGPGPGTIPVGGYPGAPVPGLPPPGTPGGVGAIPQFTPSGVPNDGFNR